MDILLITCVCADLDGTLIACKPLHWEALNIAISEVVGEKYLISFLEHNTLYDGLPTKKKLELLTQHKGLPTEKYRKIITLKNLHMDDLIDTKIKFDSRLQDILYLLGLQYRLACVTNSTTDGATKLLRAAGLYNYFEHIVSNERSSNPKPSPSPYLCAADLLGISPREGLAIEDNLYGQQSAVRAGFALCPVESPADFTLERINTFIEIYN